MYVVKYIRNGQKCIYSPTQTSLHAIVDSFQTLSWKAEIEDLKIYEVSDDIGDGLFLKLRAKLVSIKRDYFLNDPNDQENSSALYGPFSAHELDEKRRCWPNARCFYHETVIKSKIEVYE